MGYLDERKWVTWVGSEEEVEGGGLQGVLAVSVTGDGDVESHPQRAAVAPQRRVHLVGHVTCTGKTGHR